MEKSLDLKLEALRRDPAGCKEFILCDAKDPDLAFGAPATGPYGPGERRDGKFPYRSLDEFLDQIRAIVAQGEIDIMLMSAGVSERLALDERIFESSRVTPAVRANDTTDIFHVRGGSYPRVASRPFRTATVEQIQCGRASCTEDERRTGPSLGLYSMTYNNDVDRDLASLEAYKAFRLEAEAAGFRHFLEVFAPNVSGAVAPEFLGRFVTDQIIRTLAGVPSAGRPIFLKVPYLGARFLEELVHYDPKTIVGVMGGSAGTTFDAFNLIHEAQKHGARAALFGRKINNAEHQPAFVKFLRLVVEGEVTPGEAVRAYHGVLEKLGIRPRRSLRDDLLPEVDLLAGDEVSAAAMLVPERSYAAEAEPDFATMTADQKTSV